MARVESPSRTEARVQRVLRAPFESYSGRPSFPWLPLSCSSPTELSKVFPEDDPLERYVADGESLDEGVAEVRSKYTPGHSEYTRGHSAEEWEDEEEEDL